MNYTEELGKSDPKDTGVIIPYEEYADNVASLFKQMDGKEASVDHAIIGMIKELGELSEPIQKAWVYKAELDLDNIAEELGDLAFYCFAYLNLEVEAGASAGASAYLRATNTKMPNAVEGVPLQVSIIGSILSDLADVADGGHGTNRVCNILNLVFALGEIYGFTEHGILNANVCKLRKRYPSGFFQERDALARADKEIEVHT